MFSLEYEGSFDKLEADLKRMESGDIFSRLEHYGQAGVAALSAATPVDSGVTAASWYYEIKATRSEYSIIWGNTNNPNGAPIAVMLQVGHGTGTGGYVQGRDYINPALRPIFDQIAADVWREVTG